MFKKRYGKRAFKKKFTRKFPVRKRTFNKTKYGNRRFSKPTFKQTIKYGKLEDMIRNKVVVRKFEFEKNYKAFAEGNAQVNLAIKQLLDTKEIKFFISEYTEFSLTSIVIQYVCINLLLAASHIDYQSSELNEKDTYDKTPAHLLKFKKIITAGPNPVKFTQKFVLSATHKYNRTSPWVDVRTFLSTSNEQLDFSTLLPELPFTTAEVLSTSNVSRLHTRITFTVSCRNYKTDKVGFTGMAGNRAEGLVNMATGKKDYVDKEDTATLITEQYLNPDKMIKKENRMQDETPIRLH